MTILKKEIIQIQLNDTRYYMDRNKQIKYPSVSTILGKMKDTKYLLKWQENLGKKTLTKEEEKLPEKEKENLIKIRGKIEGEKIKIESQERGTKIHNQIEENVLNPKNKIKLEKKELEKFTQEYISPIIIDNLPMVEKKVIWEKGNIGFGGTFDFYAQFKKELREYKTNEKYKINKALIDWKNPLNVKYAESFSKIEGKYFPLTSYFLQTAAYVGALNQMLPDKKHKVNQTMVVLNPKKSKNIIYLYYCDQCKTYFYWEKFRELLDCYFSSSPFDWTKLNREIEEKNMIPTRIIL